MKLLSKGKSNQSEITRILQIENISRARKQYWASNRS